MVERKLTISLIPRSHTADASSGSAGFSVHVSLSLALIILRVFVYSQLEIKNNYGWLVGA